MELALTQTCQTLRRVGKRFVVSKLSQNPCAQDSSPKSHSITRSVPPIKYTNTQFHNTRSSLNHIRRYPKPFSIVPMSPISLFTNSSSSHRNRSFGYTCLRKVHISTSPSGWITPSEIEEVLESNKLPYHKGYTCYSTVCFGCCSENHDSKQLTLYINIRTGDIICKKCGRSTHWNEMRKQLLNNKTFDSPLKPLVYQYNENNNPLTSLSWLNSVPVEGAMVDNLSDEYGCISPDTYKQYNIRYLDETGQLFLLFPYYDITQKNIIGYKKCANLHSKENIELTTEIVRSESQLSLFGWHLVNDNHKEIVLTCNELDSMAIAEVAGIPTLSLPYGVTTFPPELLPYFEQFDHVILWFNNEYKSKQNLHQFANKLSLSRCSVVDNNDGAFSVLSNQGGDKVKALLQSYRSLSHDHIVTFKELADSVYSELVNAKENAGVQFQRFPVLNEYLKGHRRGELTIFTGPTGSGKTTFLSELSLDLCLQGVRTLWGSFEIKNQRLLNILLHQYSGIQLESYMEQFQKWSNSFQLLPFYFMTYYGAQDLSQVLRTIEYAIYNYDIEHIIIDNLQFMTSVNHGEDRFLVMDKAISLFRKCASDFNVHITLVVHPRKENEGNSLQTASIYGSAKATQEADNVLILQTNENLSMQISKNRYSGAIGSIPLKFNHESLCLSGFYRNVNTNEAILPVLKPRRPVQNIKVMKKGRVER